jgi:hypothetical protein
MFQTREKSIVSLLLAFTFTLTQTAMASLADFLLGTFFWST